MFVPKAGKTKAVKLYVREKQENDLKYRRMKKLSLLLAATAIATGCCNQETHTGVDNPTDPNGLPHISDFPTGEPNDGYAEYFSGRSWLAPLTTDPRLNVLISNVTFELGCRNNWHRHTGGQILIAVGGAGYYQERGKDAVRMEPGDLIEIAPDVEHWHGAAPDSWFSHLAIACNPQNNVNTWLEAVTDEDYERAVGK